MTEPSGSVRRVVIWLFVLLLAAAAGWGLKDVFVAIHDNWTHVYGDFAHGYLVLGMAAWLVVQDHRKERFTLEVPWWPALPLLMCLVIALALLAGMGVRSLEQSLVPAIVLASVAAVAGLGVARRLFWPTMLLYLAVPVWWVLNAPLQRLTAAIANALVRATGVPAFVEGNTFHLPAGVVEVASGCSGLNYLVVALALGLFQGLLYLGTWKSRIKLLVAAVVAALFANWLRVYVLILIGYVTDMQHYLIRVDHLTFGWVLFLVCFWPVFALGARLDTQRVAPRNARPVAKRAMHGWAPMTLAVLAASALLLLPGVAARLLDWRSARVAPAAAVDAVTERASMEFDGRVFDIQRTSAWSEPGVQQLPDNVEELLGAKWQTRTAEGAGVVEAIGLRYEQHTGLLGNQLAVARSGQIVAGRSAAGRLPVKLAALKGLLELRRDNRVWVVSTLCNDDCRLAAKQLEQFLQMRGNELFAVERR